MLHQFKNVSNENHSTVTNTYGNTKIAELLHSFTMLNQQFAYDLANTIQVIKDLADSAEIENPSDTENRMFRIGSLTNLLLEKINPQQFDELNHFLNTLKISQNGTN